MYILELIRILNEKGIIGREVFDDLYHLGGSKEYHYDDWGVNYLSGKHIEIDIKKIPGVRMRKIMIHYHNYLYPPHQDENGDDLETVKVPEDIVFLGDLDFLEIKNIRVYRELGQVKIGL